MKRALIITYYWPPSGGSGVQRWLKFAKYLPDHGWEPVILTPAQADIKVHDHSLLSDVSDITVHKVPFKDPATFISGGRSKDIGDKSHTRLSDNSLKMRVMKWIRANVFVPDSRILWRRPVMAYIDRQIDMAGIDAVITTGPPHSLHLIGASIAKRWNTPWMMDLRDPMSEIILNKDLRPSRWAVQRYKRIEQRLLQRADLVISTSPTMPQLLAPFDQEKYRTITNGYDHQDFPSKTVVPHQPFVLLHAGLLNQHRIPHQLMACLERVLSERPRLAEVFKWRLAGTVSKQLLSALDAYPLLRARTETLGYKSHEETLELYQSSTVLLMLMNNIEDAVEGTVLGKFYECMAAGRPVLSIGPTRSAHLPLVTDAQHFHHATYNDTKGIDAFLTSYFEPDAPLRIDRTAYARYRRDRLTSDLARCLDSMTIA